MRMETSLNRQRDWPKHTRLEDRALTMPASLQPVPTSTGCQQSRGQSRGEKLTHRKNMGVTAAATLSGVNHSICCLCANTKPLPDQWSSL